MVGENLETAALYHLPKGLGGLQGSRLVKPRLLGLRVRILPLLTLLRGFQVVPGTRTLPGLLVVGAPERRRTGGEHGERGSRH